ncbi:hypothetical protein SUGI_0099090 [Cryptomeria japonica]|nr:hypothetical protein SUGI_0099090 [Cryptomeria japonica]
MPVSTQSRKNVEWDDDELESSMGCREVNTWKNYMNLDEDEITYEVIEEAQQDPSLHKLLEKLIKTDKKKYFLLLSRKGIKIPKDFDMEPPKQTKNIKMTKSRTHTSHNDHDNTYDHSNTNDQGDTNHRDTRKYPLATLTQQLQALQQQMEDMQQGTTTQYSLEDICPYPFDQSLNMAPFLSDSEIPKYDKYNGKNDPRDHIREFCTMSLEFAHNDTYMMRLFISKNPRRRNNGMNFKSHTTSHQIN